LSEFFKDVLALVIGTVLVMLLGLSIEGGAYRILSPDTRMDSRGVDSQPVPAIVSLDPE